MRTFGKLGSAAVAAAAAAALVAAAPASAVTPTGKARGATTVTLDAATVGAIVGLGITPSAVGPAVLGGTPLQASFPITGKFGQGGQVKHVGGLALASGGTTVALTNYWIDLGRGVLTAEAAVDGAAVGRIDLFDLGAASPQSGCAATAELALSSEAADALTAVLGAPDLEGAHLGTACVAPR